MMLEMGTVIRIVDPGPSDEFIASLRAELGRLADEYKNAKAAKEFAFIEVSTAHRRLELLRDVLALDGITVELPPPPQRYEGSVRAKKRALAARQEAR